MRQLFKSSLRKYLQRPLINLINLSGLSISLTLVIILSGYAYSELRTDRHQKNCDRVYLCSIDKGIYTPAILKDEIALQIPGVEAVVRMSGTRNPTVFRVGNSEPIASGLVFADEDFFRLFSYEFVEGSPETALQEPMTVILTKSFSERLFGDEPAIGKILKLNNGHDLSVAAVIEDPEDKTCLSFSALASNETKKTVQPNGDEFTSWRFINFQTFLLLGEGISEEQTSKNVLELYPDDMQGVAMESELIPLKELYFSQYALLGSNFILFGNKRQIMILLFVAVLVMMIALVNFININASQWHDKINQTGVLKTFGAGRWVIFRHVLSDAFVSFFLAFVFAVIMVYASLPFIRNFTGMDYYRNLIFTPVFLLISIAGSLVLSTIVSLIPAWRISASKVLHNLKREVDPKTGHSGFRSLLVTAQFAITIVLLAFTLLVQKQVNFAKSNPGFDQESTIGVKMTAQLNEKKEVLVNILQQMPSVESVSFAGYFPGNLIQHWRGSKLKLEGEEKAVDIALFNADASFFDVMGLESVMGRVFTDTLPEDIGKVVVNESFLKEYSISNPVGGEIIASMDGSFSEIVGVVKDFHYYAIDQPIAPLVIKNGGYITHCIIGIHSSDFGTLHTAIENIRTEVSDLSPAFPVEISFLDQAVEAMYKSEVQFRRVFSLFAVCAIVLCSLGILAMSLSACQRRIKEIGIRKVNGARIAEVMAMLNKDFVKWVGIAFVIATPVAYYAMDKWLQNFAYRTGLSWWIFALAGMLALGIALLTVSWQSYRAASRNPVEALRYE